MATIICQQCGKEKSGVRPVHIREGRAKFCSKKCADDSRSTKITTPCMVCGTPVTVRAELRLKGHGKFCSKKCKSIFPVEKPGEIRPCDYCGKDIYVPPWAIKRHKRGNFCSKRCMYDYASANARGENSTTWKGENHQYVSSRGYVYIRDHGHHRAPNNYTKRANLVAEEKMGRLLLPGEVVHHVNGIKHDDRPENLETMSRADHNRIHGEINKSSARHLCRR